MKIIGNMGKNSIRTFSDITLSSKLSDRLRHSCQSAADMNLRVQAYSKAYENLLSAAALADRRASTRTFAAGGPGLGELSGLNPNQFIDVTVTAMIKSLAGFLSVERGVDQPTAFLPFVDLVTSGENKLVSKNIGADLEMPNGYVDQLSADRRTLRSAQLQFSNNISVATNRIEVNVAKAVIPGTLNLKVTKGGRVFNITDDKQGNIMAPAQAGVNGGEIDYRLGKVTVDFDAASGLNTGDSYSVSIQQDAPKDPTNRVKSNLNYYTVACHPEIIIAENNLIADLVATKSMNINMSEVMKKRVMDEYIKLVNRSIIDPLVLGYEGATVDIDLTPYSVTTNNMDSYYRLFGLGLIKVNTELTNKSWKSVNASAYLVGSRVAELFKGMSGTQFVPNTAASYIEDLIGHYDGIPVVKSHFIEPDTGFAIHKTADGTMAPICRAIFLPVNDIPEIGNFQNPTQFATGIYSYEGSQLLTSELVQKFRIHRPTGF